MVAWCSQNALRWQQFHVAPAMLVSTSLRWIFKNTLSNSVHSCRITCERSESARERRTALYKSDQEQHSVDELGCVQQVLFGAPEQFCKHGSMGPVSCPCFLGLNKILSVLSYIRGRTAEHATGFTGLCLKHKGPTKARYVWVGGGLHPEYHFRHH